ncbi:hypothetical protein EGP64_00750 [bacterium]|nr:hypothetical protein [bacterium]
MKNIIIGIIIGGIVFTLGVVIAATTISSKNVTYQNKTVNNALDELYNEAVTGKELVAAAITNKGVSTTSDDTYETMATNINAIQTSKKLFFSCDSTKNYIGEITVENTTYQINWQFVNSSNATLTIYKNGSSTVFFGTYLNNSKNTNLYINANSITASIGDAFTGYLDYNYKIDFIVIGAIGSPTLFGTISKLS